MTRRDLLLIIRLSRPLTIMAVVLTYILGAGIARYLGAILAWDAFLLGLSWVVSIQLGAFYLGDYFHVAPAGIREGPHSPFAAGSGALGPGKLPRQSALWAALITLTIATSLTVLLISSVGFTPQTMLVLLAILVLAFLYGMPPTLLAGSGYGELLLAIITANLVPAFAYLLQQGELHRLLAMSTFPLTALFLAMVIAFSFRYFARDVRYEIPTLLVRMGWRDGMNVHNLLIFSAYLLLGLAMLFGLPTVLALPAFLPLPLGLLQVWTMIRISAGARPNWRAIHLTAASLFFATAYLLSYAYWTR